MDNLKKYLQQNKEQMDVDTPSAGLLQRIQKQHTVTKKGNYTMFIRVAAAACFAAGIFLGVQFLFKKDKQDKTETAIVTPPVQPKEIPVTKKIDTTQQLAKVESQQVISQEKDETPKKQLPVSYQLLNSFEHNYNKLVSLQLKSIRNTPILGETPDYFNGFKIRMHQIEEDEAGIKRQIKTTGLKDELLEQLINLYQDKINLLKSLQQEIGSMNNKIKQNHEPADTIQSYYINI